MLGERIRINREKLGINQVELAKIMNVSKQTVSNWENNNRIPPTATLNKLADALDVSVDSLLNREIKCNSSELNIIDENLEKHIELAKEISKLDTDDIEFIKQMIKKLNKSKKDK